MANSIGIYTKLEWNDLPSDAGAHSRIVYVSKGELDNSRWVAKLAPPIEAKFMAEEVAYKINKILRWKTIPKTKYLHPFTDFKEKYLKYSNMMAELKQSIGGSYAYTFQKFVNGCTAHKYLYSQPTDQPIDISLDTRSYHRAFLLNVILGRGDARLVNTMLSQSTGEFFEVDNELIGKKLALSDALLYFSSLYTTKIDDDLLNEVTEIDKNKFLKVQIKYRKRIEECVLSWNEHARNHLNLNAAKTRFETYFSQIMENIDVLKSSIQAMKACDGKITSETLFQKFSHLMKIKEVEKESKSD